MTQAQAEGGFRGSRWFPLVWVVPLAVVVVIGGVLAARGLRAGPLHGFVLAYPGRGTLPEWAPTGFPAWLNWSHALNAFFMLFIIRSGLQVHFTKRPAAFFTRRNTGILKTRRPPTRISIDLWLHLTMDTLFVLNGVVFYVLIFSSGQWVRIVPTSWDVFPNAVSAVLQYASMDWPTEHGWVDYNGVQLLSYCFVVFVLAPAALLSGLRMSPAWPKGARWQSVFPVTWARRAHWPIMVIFLVFVVVHVVLVLSTGALRNLNHMYASNDGSGWGGAILLAVSVIVMAGAWIGARPVVLRALAGTMGRVGR